MRQFLLKHQHNATNIIKNKVERALAVLLRVALDQVEITGVTLAWLKCFLPLKFI